MLQAMKCAKMVERAEAFRSSLLIVTFWRTGTMTCLFSASLFDTQAHSICLWNKSTNTIHFLLRNGPWIPAILTSHPLAHTSASKDV